MGFERDLKTERPLRPVFYIVNLLQFLLIFCIRKPDYCC
jgi:hypothetical protein